MNESICTLCLSNASRTAKRNIMSNLTNAKWLPQWWWWWEAEKLQTWQHCQGFPFNWQPMHQPVFLQSCLFCFYEQSVLDKQDCKKECHEQSHQPKMITTMMMMLMMMRGRAARNLTTLPWTSSPLTSNMPTCVPTNLSVFMNSQ